VSSGWVPICIVSPEETQFICFNARLLGQFNIGSVTHSQDYSFSLEFFSILELDGFDLAISTNSFHPCTVLYLHAALHQDVFSLDCQIFIKNRAEHMRKDLNYGNALALFIEFIENFHTEEATTDNNRLWVFPVSAATNPAALPQ